jgi:hypothetical protein
MPKSLKITRPTLGTFISNPEDFADYAKEILDWIKDGTLKVNPPISHLMAIVLI